MLDFEERLRDKFQKSWVSVRAAYLTLDSDHDGFVTVEEIFNHLGP